jgi:hypothetical protein
MPEIITATSRLGLLQKEQAISGIGSIQIEKPPSKENGYKDKLAAQHCARPTEEIFNSKDVPPRFGCQERKVIQ